MAPLLTVFLLVCAAGQASAQATSETASQAYALGLQLFDAQRYEAAEQAWLRAYSLGRDPVLLLAVADTRERRQDERGAVEMLEKYLSERPDAPDRVSVEARIASLLQSPAVLLVRSGEPGESILLDGVPVEDKTPAELEVDPGMHTVLVVGEGSRTAEMTVFVGYGDTRELDFASVPKDVAPVEQSEKTKLQRQLADEKEDTTIRRAVIATGSIAAAALVGGSIAGGLVLHDKREDQRDPARSTVLLTEVSLGLAALSAITSFALYMTHRNEKKRRRDSVELRIDMGATGAAATLQF